jgi:L-ectoine synthase
MIVRQKSQLVPVDWGNGESYRFLVQNDSMGFTVAHTVVKAGSKSPLQYRRHLEACYCIAGRGQVVEEDGTVHEIEPGVLYALDKHDKHYLIAGPDCDLELVSVFSPALRGDERHSLDAATYSHY